MNILIIGSNGFIAKNLINRLRYFNYSLIHHYKHDSKQSLKKKILKSNIIFYLAGINRASNNVEFNQNIKLTTEIVDLLRTTKKKIKIIFTSSTQVNNKSPYGNSKFKSEKILLSLNKKKRNIKLTIFRLPNIFGKWGKPNYNSVVSTFCYQLTRNKKIKINSNKNINLLYIDDLIEEFISVISEKKSTIIRIPKNSFLINVKNLATILNSFKNAVIDTNFEFNNLNIKNLYSTYISYLPDIKIKSKLKLNKDNRGYFTELFKNKNSGQISFFTIKPKKIRGNHFHNSKTEKFFLLSGKVRVSFECVTKKKKFSIIFEDKKPEVFLTKPGYAHKIENIGNKDAKFIVWSNEIFDKNKPDTYKYKI